MNYSAQDVLDVEFVDGARVDQSAIGQYAIHQFKNFAGAETKCFIQWTGNTSDITGRIVLEIFNTNSNTWDEFDAMPNTYNNNNDTYNSPHSFYSITTVDTDFYLTASIPDLTNYKDAGGIITCRIYQLEP